MLHGSQTKATPRGCSFLVQTTDVDDVFIPEDFTEEHRLIRQTATEFMDKEVIPHVDRLEQHDNELTRQLMKKCGELGLLSVDIPEEFGGMGLDKVSTAIVAEAVGKYPSFATTHGGHTGIGTLPIVFFGDEEQKRKYLPRLASGEWIAAYALTEPEAGSDALSLRTSAVLSEDGNTYILNGGKIWITNAGFADLFIVFAKIDGKDLSAFIVERGYPGVNVGAEEKKLGLWGSSTCPVNFENARVPAENLLGDVGIGAKIALNILNLGRFKLGASCVGGIRNSLSTAAIYAAERHQFNRPIAEFGAIQHKLAEMASLCWVGETMVYRTVGMLDRSLESSSHADTMDILKRIEDYAVECSIIKVALSEYVDYVVDETVQIFGGYGFSAEYPPSRYYRDARINRIFEGTNEINRIVMAGMLLRKAMKGQLDLMKAVADVQKDILMPLPPGFDTSSLAREKAAVEQMKKIFFILVGKAYETYLDELIEKQQIIIILSDLLMDIYACESAVLRVEKRLKKGLHVDLERDALHIFMQGAVARLDRFVREGVGALSKGDDRRTLWGALRKYQYIEPFDTVSAREHLARKIIERRGYPFI